MNLVVYGGEGCCLCEPARDLAARAAAAAGVAMQYVTIDGDTELEARWRESIPVGVVNDSVVFKYHVDDVDALAQRITRRLRGAQQVATK